MAPRPSRRRTTRSPESTPPSKETSTRFAFFGGKGGVGKTTCAAAMAVAHVRAGRSTLLISTDPASSLHDAFQLRPPARGPRGPRRVAIGARALHLVEIDAAGALDRWLASRRERLKRIALRGTWLDEEDISTLLRLSLPGIDELAALLEIARLGRDPRFDTVIVDTAPTGHTLRMLAMPEALRALARVFDGMQIKHRAMVEALRGGWTPDAEDALIEELDDEGRSLASLLRDPVRVAMWWVTLPEPMAVQETADAVAALAAAGIPLARVVVNRITPPPPRPCEWCEARRTFEGEAIRMLQAAVSQCTMVQVRARDTEPRDVRAFAAVGRDLTGGRTLAGAVPRRVRRWRGRPAVGAPALPSLVPGATRLLMFGGKGGTGKTTCAAAAALDAAARAPGCRILLLSTDPAHSLSDVIGVPVGDAPTALPGGPPNLLVRELDAARGFAEVRARYSAAIDALFDRLTRGAANVDASADRRVMHGLIDLAPPGVDELAAVIDVTDALGATPQVERRARPGSRAAAGFDLIVMDTAPSGHALRLLETPAVVQQWARALMSILLKYQAVVGVGELGAILLRLSQGLGRLRELLADRRRCRFVAVTRGAALPRATTERLVRRLRAMGIHVPAVIVNATGRGTCVRCRAAAARERREIRALTRPRGVTRASAVVIAPAEVPPPHGGSALRRWCGQWRFGGPAAEISSS